MPAFSVSTHLLPEGERLGYLRDQLVRPHLKMDIEPVGSGNFNGFLQTFDFGPIMVAHTSITSAKLTRDARQALEVRDQFVFFDFMLNGRLTVEQDGRTVESGHKQCVVSSAVRPYVNLLEAGEAPAQMLTLSVPQSVLLRRYAQQSWGIETIDLLSGSARLLATTATQALEEVDYLSMSERAVLGETLVELVRMASGNAPPPMARRHAVYARIAEAIGALFGDADVTPMDIARRSGVSERTMRRVLADNDARLTDMLQARRVENMRALLTGGAGRHLGVTEIAFASGFRDSSTASRAFRSTHGSSPSEYRHNQ